MQHTYVMSDIHSNKFQTRANSNGEYTFNSSQVNIIIPRSIDLIIYYSDKESQYKLSKLEIKSSDLY